MRVRVALTDALCFSCVRVPPELSTLVALCTIGLCAASLPHFASAVALGGSCTTNDECTASVANSACTNNICTTTDSSAQQETGALGGACFANSTCSLDTLTCANNLCILKVNGIETCNDNTPCSTGKECNPTGLCVVPGELGSQCSAERACASGYSCTIGYCISSVAGAAKCDCTCNGGLVNTFGQLPADSCEQCSNVCRSALNPFCTTSGLGFATDENRGTKGYRCKRATSDGFEVVQSNPDGTTTTTPLPAETTPSSTGSEFGLPAAAPSTFSTSTMFVALAMMAIAAAFQL